VRGDWTHLELGNFCPYFDLNLCVGKVHPLRFANIAGSTIPNATYRSSAFIRHQILLALTSAKMQVGFQILLIMYLTCSSSGDGALLERNVFFDV
jgi:hypothetical protein